MESPCPDLMQSTSGAFGSMKRILFQPFDIAKWFVLGFSAWLAHLMESGGSFSSGNYQESWDSGSSQEDQQAIETFTEWIGENTGLVIAIASGVLIVLLATYVVLAWVRSRGKFMLLDNVVHNRCQVKQPWSEFKKRGQFSVPVGAAANGCFFGRHGDSGEPEWELCLRNHQREQLDRAICNHHGCHWCRCADYHLSLGVYPYAVGAFCRASDVS